MENKKTKMIKKRTNYEHNYEHNTSFYISMTHWDFHFIYSTTHRDFHSDIQTQSYILTFRHSPNFMSLFFLIILINI